METDVRNTGASWRAIAPPPGPLDPIVEQALDELARDYADSHREATVVLSDPRHAERIASITDRLNRARLDPVTRAVLSRPEIYSTYLAQVLAGEEAGGPETQLAQAVRDMSQALREVVAVQGQQAEALQTALSQMASTRPPTPEPGQPAVNVPSTPRKEEQP